LIFFSEGRVPIKEKMYIGGHSKKVGKHWFNGFRYNSKFKRTCKYPTSCYLKSSPILLSSRKKCKLSESTVRNVLGGLSTPQALRPLIVDRWRRNSLKITHAYTLVLHIIINICLAKLKINIQWARDLVWYLIHGCNQWTRADPESTN